MSEVQGGGAGSPGRKRISLLWAGIGVIAILAALYVGYGLVFKSGRSSDLKSLARGEMAKLVVPASPTAPAALVAEGPAGQPVSLADLKGQVVVVNLWATWCAPCVKEMPTLARLQQSYAGKPLTVMAVSLDKGDVSIAKARAFMADKAPLKFYHGDYGLAFSLTPPAEGLPTTILYDRSGREQARLSGGADWSTPEARAVLDRLLSRAG